MHPDQLGTAPQAGAIGPIRREIVFEPLPDPVRTPEPAPPEPAPPEPSRPETPVRPAEPVPIPS
jgi:hypothetical protein